MTVTTEEGGRTNMWATEPRMYISQTDAERYGYESHAERAEKLNGRVAMIGFFFAIFSYSLTGNLFFGMVWLVALFVLLMYSGLVLPKLNDWTSDKHRLSMGC